MRTEGGVEGAGESPTSLSMRLSSSLRDSVRSLGGEGACHGEYESKSAQLNGKW